MYSIWRQRNATESSLKVVDVWLGFESVGIGGMPGQIEAGITVYLRVDNPRDSWLRTETRPLATSPMNDIGL